MGFAVKGVSVYSSRLGPIRDDQFRAACGKAGVGEFLAATPTTGGLFGQNVFLTTSEGEYVFRGAPHWYRGGPNEAWQFPKEQLYADLLHAWTQVPVAWPQALDDTCVDFPWPYLITPRLPGLCLQDKAARVGMTAEDFVGVARAMGEALAGLQTLTWPFAGDFDPAFQAIAPYVGGYGGHLAAEIGHHAADARGNGALTAADDQWLDQVLAADAAAPDDMRATFAHNDFTLGNVLFERAAPGWRVSGVVDLMTCNFGDPAADLVRQSCAWIDIKPELTHVFLESYRSAGGAAAPSPERLTALVVYERLLIWAYFTRPDVADGRFQGLTFRGWAAPYVARLAEITRGAH